MIELAFETFDTPAYYSVDRAVLSSCVTCNTLFACALTHFEQIRSR